MDIQEVHYNNVTFLIMDWLAAQWQGVIINLRQNVSSRETIISSLTDQKHNLPP